MIVLGLYTYDLPLHRAMALKALDQRIAGGAASPASRQPNAPAPGGSRPPQAGGNDAVQQPGAVESVDITAKGNEER